MTRRCSHAKAAIRKRLDTSGLPFEQMAASRRFDLRGEASGLGAGDVAAEWGEPVVASPLVVEVRGGALVELLDEAELEQPRQRPIERTGVQRDGAARALRHV